VGWLAKLIAMDTPEARKAAMAGTVEDWATESLLAAGAAYQAATGLRMKPGTKPTESCHARVAGRQAAAVSGGDEAGDGNQCCAWIGVISRQTAPH
jgi:hypothetical protein